MAQVLQRAGMEPGDDVKTAPGWGRVSESTTVPKSAGSRASEVGAVHTAGGGIQALVPWRPLFRA